LGSLGVLRVRVSHVLCVTVCVSMVMCMHICQPGISIVLHMHNNRGSMRTPPTSDPAALAQQSHGRQNPRTADRDYGDGLERTNLTESQRRSSAFQRRSILLVGDSGHSSRQRELSRSMDESTAERVGPHSAPAPIQLHSSRGGGNSHEPRELFPPHSRHDGFPHNSPGGASSAFVPSDERMLYETERSHRSVHIVSPPVLEDSSRGRNARGPAGTGRRGSSREYFGLRTLREGNDAPDRSSHRDVAWRPGEIDAMHDRLGSLNIYTQQQQRRHSPSPPRPRYHQPPTGPQDRGGADRETAARGDKYREPPISRQQGSRTPLPAAAATEGDGPVPHAVDIGRERRGRASRRGGDEDAADGYAPYASPASPLATTGSGRGETRAGVVNGGRGGGGGGGGERRYLREVDAEAHYSPASGRSRFDSPHQLAVSTTSAAKLVQVM
jgi:hypothetical protein